jgi:hypothetical protein
VAFREVGVHEVREVLRLWLRGEGFRSVARLSQVDRKTVRRYVEAALACGLDRAGGEEQLGDELLSTVAERIRPHRADGHGASWALLSAHHARLEELLDAGLTVVKAGELLAREGVVVPERTLHRYALQVTGQLLKRLKAARLDNSHDEQIRKLLRVDLLILDDFCLQPMDATDTADIYEIIVERHRAAATITTSNREPAEWLALMADPLLAQSAIDRLQSAAYELVLDGESYRHRQKPAIPSRASQQP